MNENQPGVTDLFQRATDELEAPSAQLVAAGVTRGRALRRRHQIGTAVAAAAVFGVIGATAAVVPSLLGGEGRASDDAGFATQPESAPLPTPTSPVPSPTDKAEPQEDPVVTPRAGAPALSLPAADFPATIETLLGAEAAGEALTEAPYPLVDEPHQRIAHFRWNGMLVSVIIDPVAVADAADCAAFKAQGSTCAPLANGKLATYWGPDTADEVTAHGAVVWSGAGYRVSVLAYNAADGKEVPPVQTAPALIRAQMETIASSDVWYR